MNAAWQGGRYTRARHVDSPNFGARPPGAKLRLIVIHSISLPPGVYGAPFIERLFTNTLDCDAHPYFQNLRNLRVSSHFVIDRDGALTQYVDIDQRAWHAGVSHYLGADGCNDFSVGIELEGLAGDTFTAGQYAQLATLCRAVAERASIEAIAGHEHIAPGRKNDPGPGFDWRRLQRDLGWAAAMFPPQTMG